MRGAYGRGHTTRGPKDLENNTSATASSAMWLVRMHGGGADPWSTGWTDILLFLFKRAERESGPFKVHPGQ